MTDPQRAPAFVLVDAHVHVHSCFAWEDLLEAALRNFRDAAASLGLTGPFTGCLLLAEMGEDRWFRRARAEAEEGGTVPRETAPWKLLRTEEESSLLARRVTGESLVLIAGRQVAVREGLEVLALGRDAEIADGLLLEEVLRRVRESGALPVLPWGFGKWWGRRGAIVAGALAGRESGELYLGDNSCRLELGSMPRLFQEARSLGVRVLPGTDPLPFPEHCGRAGSYGFVLEGPLDGQRPAEDLLRRVRALRGQPRIYGRREALPRFVRDQVAMQWRRRKPLAPVPSPAASPDTASGEAAP